MNNNEVGVYVHIPFCKHKCDYCDFISYCNKDDLIEKYIKALIKEIKSQNIKPWITTIYIGGGTPSYIDSKYIKQILQEIKKKNITKNTEITIEVNPGTVTKEKLEDYKECGINRLSIGLQVTQDKILKDIGRIHNYEQFLETYEAARDVGFRNINVDLMSALPLQTVESYENTLKTVTALNPEHISAYSLIIEEGTPFYEKYAEDEKLRNEGGQPELLPDEDSERRMYELTEEILNTKGYNRYEISNYAKKGFECRHNIGYWTGKDYISAGIGASSYIEDRRFVKTDNMSHYLNGDFDEYEIVTLDKKMKMEEFMFLGLRMTAGISKKDFTDRFNISIEDVYGSQIQKLIGEGLIISDNDNLHLSKKGIDVSNYVFEEFLL